MGIYVMGHRTTWLQMILSNQLASEYRRQIPGAKNKFCCCDCGASFHHMHMLATHIQTTHVAHDQQNHPRDADNGSTVNVSSLDQVAAHDNAAIESDPTRTGE